MTMSHVSDCVYDDYRERFKVFFRRLFLGKMFDEVIEITDENDIIRKRHREQLIKMWTGDKPDEEYDVEMPLSVESDHTQGREAIKRGQSEVSYLDEKQVARKKMKKGKRP